MHFKLIYKNNIIGRFLNAVTALFLVLNCQSVWQKSLDKNYHIYEICFVLIVLNALYTTFVAYRTNKVSIYAIKVSIIYLILISIILVLSVSQENIIRFLSRFLVFPLFMFYFRSNISEKDKLGLFFWFANWAAIIAWISNIFWLLSTLGIIGETSTVNIDWFGRYGSYYGLYFSSPYQCIDWLGSGIRRNIGIFTEGPMFMYVLVMSLVFMDLISEYYEIKKWKIIGIFFALVTIASVTGYIIVLFLAGMKLMHVFKRRRTQIFLGMIASIFFVIGALVFLSLKQDTASYLARFDDYLAGLKCWLNSPLYGNGYENLDLVRTYMSNSRSWNQGFSNTIFSILAYGGVLFLMVYFIPTSRGIYLGIKKSDYKLFQFSVTILLLYFTVISYTFYINFAIWAFLMCKYQRCNMKNKGKLDGKFCSRNHFFNFEL